MFVPHLRLQTVSKGIRVKPWLKQIAGEAPVHTDLKIFHVARALAQHSGQRQAIIAQNVANSDTPGYKARDMASFHETLADISLATSSELKATRASHLNFTKSHPRIAPQLERGLQEPSGNSVSIEEEMMKAAEVTKKHSRALTIYQSSLRILRTSLGRS